MGNIFYKMIINFIRIIKFGWQNFVRNIWLSLVTIVIIILTLISITGLLIFNVLTDNTLKAVQNKTDIYIDINPAASPEQINQLVDSLSKVPHLNQVKYVSSEENLNIFLKNYENNPTISDALKTLENNPFKASLLIKVDQVESFPLILNALSEEKYSTILEINDDDFTQAKNLITKISEYSQKIKKAGLVISLLFSLIAILIVFNAIQISIYDRREEIAIMRLVGAANYYIKGPFYIEGIIYSFVSLIILLIIIYPLLIFIQPYLNNFFSEYATNLIQQVNNNFLKIFGIELILAVFLNIISASIAMKKYLKI